jgi:phage tail-like protein
MISGNMPKSLYQNWQFAIEINGFDVALFKKGQEPKIEFEEVAFAPAGSLFDQKVAGRMKFGDLTFEKGVLQDGSDTAAMDWIKKIGDVNAATGGLPSDYMKDVDVVRYDRKGSETGRWTLHGCWVKTLEYDDLEGGNTEASIEKLSLTYQYATK